MAKRRVFTIDAPVSSVIVCLMSNLSQCEERRPVFLLAAAADLHPATAAAALSGKRISRKSRAALVAAKSSLSDITRELVDAIERATATNEGAK